MDDYTGSWTHFRVIVKWFYKYKKLILILNEWVSNRLNN